MAKLRVTSDALVGLVAVVTLPAGILSAMLFGEGIAGIVFVVGWLLLVPAIAIVGDEMLVEETDDDPEDRDDQDPIEALRDRYARGEIDEVEFERRLEGLLATEDADADDEASIERAIEEVNAGGDRVAERE